MNNRSDGNNTNSRLLPSPPAIPTDEALIEVKCADSRYKKWNDTISFRWPTSAATLKDGDGEYAPNNYCESIKKRVAETYGVHKSDVKLKFRRRTAPATQKNKQPSILDEYVYGFVSPLKDKLYAYIDGMQCIYTSDLLHLR